MSASALRQFPNSGELLAVSTLLQKVYLLRPDFLSSLTIQIICALCHYIYAALLIFAMAAPLTDQVRELKKNSQNREYETKRVAVLENSG